MRLLTIAGISLGGWIAIIIIHTICNFIARKRSETNFFLFSEQSSEIVKDGNNLFSTMVFYFIMYLVAYFTNFAWLHWVLFGVSAACCVPPIISLFALLPQTIYWRSIYMSLAYVAHIINTFVPAVVSTFILFDFCI